MVFTVEQLRLPMAQRDLPQVIVSVVDQPMTMVQAWYDHAIQEFHNAAAAKAKGFGGRSSPRQVNDHGAAQRQLVFMELAIACVLQLKERFLHAQMPLLLDALRPLCWSTVSVEAALQCVLGLLHGCYHEPHPL